jgi:hypothetical protein
MAYGLKYYFVDKKIVGSTETTYRFEILEDGYSGSSTEWTGVSIQRQYEELSFRQINNIQKSSCSGQIRVEDSAQRTILESIASSELGDYQIKLKKDGSVVWTGLLVPDLTTITEENYGNQSANLQAKDIFFSGDYTLATGAEKAIVIIADLLDTLSYGLNIKTYTTWTESEISASDDVLNQVYHEKERLRTYAKTSGEVDRPISNEQALIYMLKTYGLILRQANNEWQLIQLSALDDTSSVPTTTYNSSGVQQGSPLTNVNLRESIDSDDLFLLGSSTNNYFAGIKRNKAKFDHQSVVQGIKIPRELWLTTTNESYSQFWQGDGTGNISLEFNLWVADTGSLAGTYPSAQIRIQSGSYYWNGTAWGTNSTEITIEVSGPTTTDSDGNHVYKSGLVSIVTDPIPDAADGTLTITFIPSLTIVTSVVYSYFRDIIFNLSFQDDIENSLSIDFELEQTGTFNAEYDYGSFYFGDGPATASLSALKDSNNDLTDAWKQIGEATSVSHQEILLREILDFQRGQRRNIRATLYGEFEPDKVVQYDSKSFFFLGGSWDSKSYQWTSNLIEADPTTGTDTLTTYYNTTGEGVTTSASTGSTGGGSGSSSLYLEKVNNLSDLQSVSTARDNLGLGTGDDVVFNTVTADFIGDLTGAIHVQGKNDTGGTLTKGTPVYISGQVAEGQQFTIGVADSDGSGTMPSIGVLSADVNNNAMGDIVTHGKLIGIDTSSFTVGDELFIGSSGTLVNTPPTGESNLLQKIAKVIRVNATDGQIYIMGAGRTNAVPNLDEGKIFAGDANNQAVTTDVIDVNIASNLVTINDDLTVTGVVRTNELDAQADLVWNTAEEVWNTSDYYFTGAINLAGSLYITDELDVAESVSVGTTLDVSGNTTILGTLDAPTLNTGQGDNELYAMNQDVQTTDGVIFDTLSVTNSATVGGSLTLTGSADFNSTMNLQGNLTTQANLQDDGYATGWSGTNWQIQADGSAELQELRVRGALRVFEFIAKQISTIGGSEILSIAQGRVVSVDSDNDTITVENVTGTAGNSFKVNDLFICQVTDINNDLESGGTGSIVKSVRGGVIGVVGNDIEVSITSGNLTDLVTGDLIVAYGNTTDADRQAIMYRNVDRSEDSLIMRMQTDINAFSDLQNEANTRVAFGDLGPRPSNSTGYSGLTSETFGFFAGDNSAEHILVTDGGLFLKDGTSTLAQLTSNTFKVGDSTNFLSFNGTTFDIQTDTFNLDTTNLDISSANENIVIGTGSALMTVGKLSSAEQGIKIDSNGITNQNYWKLGQGTVQFKVGDGTNFLSFNENAGTFEIETEQFTLDTTDSGAESGIKIDSSSQEIELYDANKVRTVIDINSGGYTLTETTHHNAGLNTIITQTTTPYETSVFAIDEGDSLYVDVEAKLSFTGSGTPDPSPSFYIEGQIYGGTLGTATNLVANFLGTDCVSINDLSRVTFSAFNYSYTHYKVKIVVNGNNTGNDARFTLTSNLLFRSADSRSRFGLDGLYIDSSNEQYARLTREENKLAGITKLVNIPSTKPIEPNVVYKDSNGFLKIS